MDILKAIFDSVFNIVAGCFSAIDIDLFGVGFTILDFFISVLLLGLVFRFLGKSLSISDSFSLASLYLKNMSSISNQQRETFIIKNVYKDGTLRKTSDTYYKQVGNRKYLTANDNYYSAPNINYDLRDWL